MTDTMIKNESRRDFLKVSGTVVGGLALSLTTSGPRVVKLPLSLTGRILVPITKLPFLLQDLKWARMFIHPCLCLLLKVKC